MIEVILYSGSKTSSTWDPLGLLSVHFQVIFFHSTPIKTEDFVDAQFKKKIRILHMPLPIFCQFPNFIL